MHLILCMRELIEARASSRPCKGNKTCKGDTMVACGAQRSATRSTYTYTHSEGTASLAPERKCKGRQGRWEGKGMKGAVE